MGNPKLVNKGKSQQFSLHKKPKQIVLAIGLLTRYFLWKTNVFPRTFIYMPCSLNNKVDSLKYFFFLKSTFGNQLYYLQIALGQGQETNVDQLLAEAANQGQWLCLKNLHLMSSWLSQLDKLVQDLNPHTEFRLWLTTEPHIKFPSTLVKSCLKVAYEVINTTFIGLLNFNYNNCVFKLQREQRQEYGNSILYSLQKKSRKLHKLTDTKNHSQT